MKVLYLNNYDTSFIQNQILDLKEIGGIEAQFIVHLSYWVFYKYKKGKISNIFSSSQLKSLSEKELSLLLHFGLPKNILLEKEPYWTAKKILKRFSNHKFDLIHAQNGFPSGLLAMFLAEEWKIPYIVTSHGMDTNRCLPDSYEQTGIRRFSPAVINCYRKALLGADKVIGVSKAFAQLIKQIVPEIEPVAIQNSYNKFLFKPGNKEEIRKTLKLNSKDIYLIFVGNLIKPKRHIDIVRALKIINKANVKLILIGQGKEKENILNEINTLQLTNKIILIPFLSQEELAKWYIASDIVIFPSLKDSFGLSLVEAMACSCPAISTKTYGPQEIVLEGQNGFLVDFKSPQQIADKIIYLLNNPDKRREMGINAAESVYQRYANKNMELFELYQDVIKNYVR